MFKTSNDFIEVDFSDWKNDDSVQKTFNTLQNYIVNKQIAFRSYRNLARDEHEREGEPLKLIFKSKNWHLYAFCRFRQENRLFRLARVRHITIKNELFDRVCDETNIARKLEWNGDVFDAKIRISKDIKGRTFEEVPEDKISVAENGDLIIETKLPLDDWMLGYLLSLGDKGEIIEPLWLKEKIREIHLRASKI